MSALAKILIVDDDPDLVASLRVLLESRSYEVISASNREKGMNMAKEEQPDLIILDVMMSMLSDGFELSRYLKMDPQCSQIPILMLTGFREETGYDFSKDAGDERWLPVEAFMHKPFQGDELIERVEELLKQYPPRE